MGVLGFALWGAFGGFAIEVVEILGAIKRLKRMPWKVPGELSLGGLITTVVIRLGLGTGLAMALATSGQISGALGAVASGVAAPFLLEQMAKQLPSKTEAHLPELEPADATKKAEPGKADPKPAAAKDPGRYEIGAQGVQGHIGADSGQVNTFGWPRHLPPPPPSPSPSPSRSPSLTAGPAKGRPSRRDPMPPASWRKEAIADDDAKLRWLMALGRNTPAFRGDIPPD